MPLNPVATGLPGGNRSLRSLPLLGCPRRVRHAAWTALAIATAAYLALRQLPAAVHIPAAVTVRRDAEGGAWGGPAAERRKRKPTHSTSAESDLVLSLLRIKPPADGNEDDDGAESVEDGLPEWLTEYMAWHRAARATLTPDTWQNHHYLVLRCLSWFPFCSGTCDRLRNFYFLLYLASLHATRNGTTPRLFLVHWSRPAALEEFLVPPPTAAMPGGGLDWRVPDWLLPKLALGNESHWAGLEWNERTLIEAMPTRSHYPVVEFSFIFQLAEMVESDVNRPLYRKAFRALFRPSPPVKRWIDETQKELGLWKRPYAALHLRTKYTSLKESGNVVLQALQCAERVGGGLPPDWPLLIASDNEKVARLAERLAVEHNLTRKVVARQDYVSNPPLHLDVGLDFLNPYSEDWKNHNASEYYNVFGDLLLVGDARCVVGGTGNYGRWGSMLSRNESCWANYITGAGCRD